MLLRLDSFDWWPPEIMKRAMARRELLQAVPFTDEVYRLKPFRSVLEDLEAHIRTQRIVGYHCTKEPEPGFFEALGLRTLDRISHQAKFLNDHGWRFTDQEMKEIHHAWESYFSGQQEVSRNGKIWFCLAPHQVVDGGADNLLIYFGGEAVYMPFRDGTPIAQKLSTIGNSVVVEAAIVPDDLTTFTNNALAKNSLHVLHWTLNPEVSLSGFEGFVSRAILPEEILQVTPMDSFFSAYSRYIPYRGQDGLGRSGQKGRQWLRAVDSIYPSWRLRLSTLAESLRTLPFTYRRVAKSVFRGRCARFRRTCSYPEACPRKGLAWDRPPDP
jgi:hypothetical protein